MIPIRQGYENDDEFFSRDEIEIVNPFLSRCHPYYQHISRMLNIFPKHIIRGGMWAWSDRPARSTPKNAGQYWVRWLAKAWPAWPTSHAFFPTTCIRKWKKKLAPMYTGYFASGLLHEHPNFYKWKKQVLCILNVLKFKWYNVHVKVRI